MSSVQFSIKFDSRDFHNKMNQLKPKIQDKTIGKALQKASNQIVKAARNNLRASIKASDKMLKGIKAKRKSATFFKVHILGDFRLKFFESGTKSRSTKKGWDRGQIKATYFFSKAYNTVNTEQIIINEIDKILSKIH